MSEKTTDTTAKNIAKSSYCDLTTARDGTVTVSMYGFKDRAEYKALVDTGAALAVPAVLAQAIVPLGGKNIQENVTAVTRYAKALACAVDAPVIVSKGAGENELHVCLGSVINTEEAHKAFNVMHNNITSFANENFAKESSYWNNMDARIGGAIGGTTHSLGNVIYTYTPEEDPVRDEDQIAIQEAAQDATPEL